MAKSSKLFPVFITIAAPLIFFAVMRAGYQQNIGPVCDVNENFASPGRPAYAHHCKCFGIRYFEAPGSGRPAGSEATRCLGMVKRSWLDTDETALKDIAEKERHASSQRVFDKLSPPVQEKLKVVYRQLQQATFRHDYPRVRELAAQILQEVDDFNDTRAMDLVAQNALNPPVPPTLEPASTSTDTH
jgi:hypothetical protein